MIIEFLVFNSNTWNLFSVPKLNFWYPIAVLGTIWLCANEWIMFNRIIWVKQERLKSLHCQQTNY